MISEIAPYNNYTGDGTTTQFDFDFFIEDGSQLKVEHTNSSNTITVLEQDIDYTLCEFYPVENRTPDYTNGGYIIFPKTGSTYSTLASTEKISLQLTLPIEQQSEYGTSSELDLENIEYSYDYLTRIAQIQNRKIDRAIKIQEGSDIDVEGLVRNMNVVATNITGVNNVADDIPNINSVNNDLTNIDIVAGSISDVNSVATNMSIIQSVDDNETNINAVNLNKTNINTVAGSISNVNAVGTSIANVNSVAGDLTNINAVNSNKTNIDTVAGKISYVETVGENITDVETCSNIIDDIQTCSTNKTKIGNVSNNMPKVSAVYNNLTEITSVYSDLTNVDTVATNISDVSTVATSITNVNNVGNSISNVNTVSGNLTNINTAATNISDINTCATNIVAIQGASDNAELAELWAKGPESDLQTKTSDPTSHSSKYYSEQSASAQIQADCAQSDTTSKAYINNKDLQYFSNATTNFTNINLSDLSSAGKLVLDGQWVYSYLRLAYGVTWNNSHGIVAYNLSSYLPNDGQIYEVIFCSVSGPATTANKFVNVYVSTDIITNSFHTVSSRCAVTGQVNTASASFTAIVGNGRVINVLGTTSSNASGTYDLIAHAYRRIGTNV